MLQYSKLRTTRTVMVAAALWSMLTNAGVSMLPPAKRSRITPSVSESELEAVDHTMGNLAHFVEQLVEKGKWLRNFNLTELAECAESRSARVLAKKFRVQLAALIVREYWENKIPLFNDIVAMRQGRLSFETPTVVNEALLGSASLNELQQQLEKAALKGIAAWRSHTELDSSFFSGNLENSNFEADKTTSEPKNSWPPPLPPIKNAKIERQVFVHRSSLNTGGYITSGELLKEHNERLEFKGDGILNFVIGEMLFERFPNDNEGDLSIKKAKLVCNETLYDLSEEYGLHKRLRMSEDMRKMVFNGSDLNRTSRNKCVADVFEAYLGGVALDSGLHVARKWLRLLFEPLVDELSKAQSTHSFTNRSSKQDEEDAFSKNELYQKVGSKNIPITYEVVGTTKNNEFEVRCCIMGEEVSRGVGRNTRVAGHRAARAVLNQKEIVEKFAEIRRREQKTVKDTGK